MVDYNTTRIEEAQSLWTHQLKAKDVIDAITAAVVQQSQDKEQVLYQLRQRLDIDTQVGVQLDKIGVLVGQPRQGLLDDIFRLWLKARIRVNRSSGSNKDMYQVAELVLGTTIAIYLEHIPVGHLLHVPGKFPYADIVAVQRILQDTSPVAVPFYLQYAFGTYDRIETASGSTPVAASNNGLDNGRLVDWLGPDQTPDPYANIQYAFGRRLIDCWDCKKISYNSSNEAIRVVGLNSEMTPFLNSPTKSTTLRKESIEGATFNSRKTFINNKNTGLFGGSDPWTVAIHLTTGIDLDNKVFEVTADPTINSGSNAYLISISANTTNVIMTLYNGGSGASFFLGNISTSTVTSLIVSYDGNGLATCWVNGSKTTDTATHFSVPNLQYMCWGQYDSTDDTNPWDSYKLAIFDRVLTDTEAQLLTDILDREFTDNAYY